MTSPSTKPAPVQGLGMNAASGGNFVADTLARGVAAHQQRLFKDAEACYRAVLRRDPDHFEAQLYLGISLCERKAFGDAIPILKKVARSYPGAVDAHANLARALKENGQHQLALSSVNRALELDPGFVEAHNECGMLYAALDAPEQAEECYRRALALRPDYAEALYNRGNSLAKLGRFEEALECYEGTLRQHPALTDALHNRGNVLHSLRRFRDAAVSYELALRSNPRHMPSLLALAKMLEHLHVLEQALEQYAIATEVDPESAMAWFGKATILHRLSRNEEAADSFEQVVQLNPNHPGARCMAAMCRMYCCDWSRRAVDLGSIHPTADDQVPWTTPWLFVSTSDNRQNHLRWTRLWAATFAPPMPAPMWHGERYDHARIRIAYLSADFHQHATAMLMAGVFEHHDRERFETIAISFGPDSQDAMRTRLLGGFDQFINMADKTDEEVAKLMRDLEVDIAVDLKGYTTDSRYRILSYRPAPVQVNYLGYPGTMAADYIDYVIADRVVIPPEDAIYYTEKVAYLPDCYQANDDRRPIAELALGRMAVGLPEDGFVFCCFNNNFKITPEMFAIWMRLLYTVERSVLWLLEDNAAAARNLRQEAVRLGISAERLVFAPRVTAAEHLARHRLADLVLDTLPCNAHTTASDALWAGAPVITCLGKSFAGRVCASLLHAAELPELVTTSLDEYEQLARRLASDRQMLGDLTRKLRVRHKALPLFNTERFTRNLEAVYLAMMNDLHSTVADHDHLPLEH